MRRRSCLIYLTNICLFVCLVVTMGLFSGLTRGEEIALDALSHLEAPYVFGKAGPEKFDCSGLIVHCFRPLDITVRHSAKEIYEISGYGELTSPNQLRTGDIICFDTVSDDDLCDHVGIWLGGNRFVHASSSKKKVVISELEDYYLERFTGGRRIICPYF